MTSPIVCFSTKLAHTWAFGIRIARTTVTTRPRWMLNVYFGPYIIDIWWRRGK